MQFVTESLPTMMRIVLFTDQYPFGEGEKPFVIPEIDRLLSHYQFTIVSCAQQQLLNAGKTSDLPDGVDLICAPLDNGARNFVRGLDCVFDSHYRKELVMALRSGGKGLQRVALSVVTYGSAKMLLKRLEREGLFNDLDQTLFYTFWFNHATLACALKKDDEPNLRLISRIHGYDLYNERASFGRQPWQQYKRDACNRIVFASQNARDYFLKAFPKAGLFRKCPVNRLGVQRGSGRQEKPANGKWLLVSCSNTIPIKRVELIAEALSHIDPDFYLWVHFGDGPCREALLEYCKVNRVNLDYRGQVPNKEIADFYAENYVDFFVTTSSSEGGCPVSIQEAMAAGVPILGTAVGGIPEQIDGNGILLPENPSPLEVLEAMQTLMSADDHQVQAMRHRSLQIWDELFNVEKNKSTMLAIVDEVVHSAEGHHSS